MKRLFFALVSCLIYSSMALAQVPDWVSSHPISDKEYIGIGVASLSDTDYMKKATQNALADIASQIAVKLEDHSFLHTIDVDGKSRELFEDKIQTTLGAWLEGQELKETYQSDQSYYVYYTLDKKLYAQKAKERQNKVIQTGLDYLQKGRDAENLMNLSQAVQLYAKGLEAVEPWLFMDLIAGGKNVPTELYHAYVNVFSNMAITTNVTQVEGEAFKAIPTPIA
ncbi:MAG: LPP20 family lipoprotein, partial [Paraprevotella sp.]|nr:LPP20 family lipoprotein [Paraprevotella sp.]